MLRFVPFDTSTEEGRSRERNRRIAWTSVSAVTAKGSAALAMLFTIPITLDYLGPERFGLWMAASATVAMLSFADFGLSNGLMNAIAKAKGNDDVSGMQAVVANGFVMLFSISTAIALLFAATYASIPWSSLFNVKSPLAMDEAGPLVATLMVCFVANLPAVATQKVQLGLQRGYLANAWETIGSACGLVGVIVAVSLGASLAVIALAMAGLPVLARVLNSVVFFSVQMPSLRPRLTLFDSAVVSRLFRIGGLFLILQLAVVVGFQSDNLIIARILGAEAVAAYDVALKLAMLPPMLISFVAIAQWPAYAEAAGRGDLRWIRKTFVRTLRTGLIVSLAFAVLLVIFGQQVILLWAGADVVPGRVLLACFAVWSVLSVAGGAIAALLNGLHVVGFQAINSSLMAVANVLLSIYLVGQLGVLGAIAGSIGAYVVFTLVPCAVFIHRLFSRDGAAPYLGADASAAAGVGTSRVGLR
ncbi:MAG: oligosaccharide flippase family protein [Planctomycetota bacterium]